MFNKLNIESIGNEKEWCSSLEQDSQETYADEDLAVQENQVVNDVPKVSKQVDDVEFVKKNRFSALVDGVCMGIGFVFLILGIAMPMMMPTQLIVGLLLIIGAILCLATGAIVEVYQWAKLD